jgi:hypothetical protein
MTLEELESSWSSVPPPADANGINGRRATGLPHDKPVYLVVDGRGHRHLLIQVPDGTTPVTQRETRSLEVATSRFQVGPNPEALYVDLACTDPAQHPTFSAVAQDILRSVIVSPAPIHESVVNALARWRAFWSAGMTGMSREVALGLFGELWFMRRWLGAVGLHTIERWQATEAARHDFQWPAASVEVKTAASRSVGEPVHRIGGLDQLADSEQGQLYLFSLQVCDDALAANTVHSLVEGLVVEVRNNFQALTLLNEKLAARGYTPADRQAACRPLRIVAERLYRIDRGFPRLVRDTFRPAGLPSGVLDVEYAVDLAACRQWLVATSPTDAAAAALR